MQKSSTIHQESIVIDTHCDTLLRVLGGNYRLGERNNENDIDIPRALEGGITVQFFAACGSNRPEPPVNWGLKVFDAFYNELAVNSDRLMLATCVADIERAKQEGKLAGVLSLEGGNLVGGDLAVLRMYYRLGVRAMTLVHFKKNDIAESVTDMPDGTGLTDFGVEVVKEMNRLGMLCDVAHLSPTGFYHLLDITDKPIIDSHANAKALCDHVRNLDDAQLKALAQNGGVIGASFVPAFIDKEKPSLQRLLDHIEHIAEVAGIEHVGLGSDFDGFSGKRPEGLEDVTRVPNITEGLIERGYSEEDVKKVLGENFLRVIREVMG